MALKDWKRIGEFERYKRIVRLMARSKANAKKILENENGVIEVEMWD